ncbi:MAG: exo-alpha-sialidase [Clostridia bacterium]|nr:exo-alpha-sialidase [Clostridia bacterium]
MQPSLPKSGHKVGPDTYIADRPFAEVPDAVIIRIPGAITLQNGSIFLTADMRYSAWTEAGGIDIVAALSEDGGQTWHHSWPIYFPDSTDSGYTCACTAIDSMCVQGPDGTVFVAANVSPTGISCVTDPGFIDPGVGRGYVAIDGVQRLVLTARWEDAFTAPSADDGTRYCYYVGDYQGDFAPVLCRADGTATSWVVDDALNLYTADDHTPLTQEQYTAGKKNGTLVQQNVFFRDAVLHVYNTQYLWLASSRDGKNWRHRILESIKRENEREARHGTGHGIVTADGTVLLPGYVCYKRGDDAGGATVTFLYSKDNGETWQRPEQEVAFIPGTTCFNECETVELADGTLRTFLRSDGAAYHRILYADARWDAAANTYVFAQPVVTEVTANNSCKMSAITYSRPIDGCQAVLVSYPAAPTTQRNDGRIFTFLIREDNRMELAYTYDCPKFWPSPSFGYSNMTELSDGKIGLFYEPTAHFIQIPIEEICPGAQIG